MLLKCIEMIKADKAKESLTSKILLDNAMDAYLKSRNDKSIDT